MRRLSLILLFLVLVTPSYALNDEFANEGQRLTSVSVELSFDSELKLPTEGDSVNYTFIMTPYLDSIKTNENFVVIYFLTSPEGALRVYGYSSFPKGPYEKGNYYSAHGTYNFDTPGIWNLEYMVATNNDTQTFKSPQEFQKIHVLRYKKIHVLSFSEASSLRISNKSYEVSILGIITTFLAFILGIFANYIIEHYKFSPKIKVICNHGFVSNMPTGLIRVFSIEAINYGRTAVTLSSVGIEIKNKNEVLQILESEIVRLELPKELLPGKSYTVIKNYENLKQTLNGKIPKRAFFADQTNRKYYSNNIENFFILKN